VQTGSNISTKLHETPLSSVDSSNQNARQRVELGARKDRLDSLDLSSISFRMYNDGQSSKLIGIDLPSFLHFLDGGNAAIHSVFQVSM
jgi:hypothetical protein